MRRELLDRALLADVDAARGGRARRARRRDRARATTAACRPSSAGSGSVTRRPVGETSTVSCTLGRAGREELGPGEPERLEVAQRAGGEAVAARLVARESRLVDAHDRAAAPPSAVIAAAIPPGPAPTTTTSTTASIGADGSGARRIRTAPAARFDFRGRRLPESLAAQAPCRACVVRVPVRPPRGVV